MHLNSQSQAVDYGQLINITYNNSAGNIKTYKWYGVPRYIHPR